MSVSTPLDTTSDPAMNFPHDIRDMDIMDIVDASSLLRNGIVETPGLVLVGDALLNLVAFTIRDRPNLIHRLNQSLRDDGWHFTVLTDPPALQVCITNPMTARMHELVRLIQEKYFLLTRGYTLASERRTHEASSRYLPPQGLQSIKHQDVLLAHVPIFRRYPRSSLLMMFGNVCGR